HINVLTNGILDLCRDHIASPLAHPILPHATPQQKSLFPPSYIQKPKSFIDRARTACYNHQCTGTSTCKIALSFSSSCSASASASSLAFSLARGGSRPPHPTRA